MTAPRARPVLVALAIASAPPATAQPSASAMPPGANASDRAAPFFVDPAGLDFSTAPPTRDPRSPAYPTARELADAALPPKGALGNFIIGPSHPAAPESLERPGAIEGHVETFVMTSAQSRIYRPGRIREEASDNAAVNGAKAETGDPSHLIVTSSRQGSWSRPITVYRPAGAGRGEPLPFIVVGDGESRTARLLVTVLDNLIAARRLPAMAAILIGSGGQDAQGSERGREYDAVSGTYAEWVETEVLPEVERRPACA